MRIYNKRFIQRSVHISPTQWKWLKERGDEEMLSASAMIRKSIDVYKAQIEGRENERQKLHS